MLVTAKMQHVEQSKIKKCSQVDVNLEAPAEQLSPRAICANLYMFLKIAMNMFIDCFLMQAEP
jgi:hypothetical protein